MSEKTQDAGLLAYENGDYTTAFNEWLALAKPIMPKLATTSPCSTNQDKA